MPTLRDLEGQFIAWRKETEEERFARGAPEPADLFIPANSIATAHGIHFLCPKAFAANGGNIGTHRIQVYFAGSPVPDHLGKNKDGQTVRWAAAGNSLDDLSLTPSIQEQDTGCAWHGFVGSNGVPPGSAQ